MILTGKCGALVGVILTGFVEHLWGDTDRGEWSIGEMILKEDCGSLVK
jgi:hypothetical protein